MKQKEGFIHKEERIEIIEKLNKIPGVNKPHSQAGTYPTFSIKLLSHQKSFDLFLEYLNWFDDKIEEMLEDEND